MGELKMYKKVVQILTDLLIHFSAIMRVGFHFCRASLHDDSKSARRSVTVIFRVTKNLIFAAGSVLYP